MLGGPIAAAEDAGNGVGIRAIGALIVGVAANVGLRRGVEPVVAGVHRVLPILRTGVANDGADVAAIPSHELGAHGAGVARGGDGAGPVDEACPGRKMPVLRFDDPGLFITGTSNCRERKLCNGTPWTS